MKSASSFCPYLFKWSPSRASPLSVTTVLESLKTIFSWSHMNAKASFASRIVLSWISLLCKMNNAYVQYRSVNHQVRSDCSGETRF